jgi:hypothetical protein
MQMDIWYELALREMSDVNGAATEIRREAELLDAATEEADEDDDGDEDEAEEDA